MERTRFLCSLGLCCLSRSGCTATSLKSTGLAREETLRRNMYCVSKREPRVGVEDKGKPK